MIDTSPAIEKVESKVIYIRMGDNIMAISDGKNQTTGKWHIIDLCFGNYTEALTDLKSQGYTIKKF